MSTTEFHYIFVMFSAADPIPTVQHLNNEGKKYRFAPLSCGATEIYTADVELWRLNKASGLSTFCPAKEEINAIQKLAEAAREQVIVALIRDREIAPPGSSDTCIELESWEVLSDKGSIFHAIELGFDVLDSWTGISALANVGYDSADLKKLEELKLQANEYGLLKNASDANDFAGFATTAVPEHAPYLVAKVCAWRVGQQ